VRDTIDLQGSEIDIPSDSVLEFAGGGIKNGDIHFNNTLISGYARFTDCSYSGRIINDEVELEWFDFRVRGTDGNVETYSFMQEVNREYVTITIDTYKPEILQQIIDCCKSGAQLNVDKVYGIKAPVTIRKKIYLKGYDRSEGIYANMIAQNMEYGFHNCGLFGSLFVVEDGGEISMQGLSLIGYTSLYMGGQLWEKCYGNGNPLPKPVCICGIDVKRGGRINEVHDSSFVAFTYGIRSDGGSIGLIRNSYFSLCRFGFWANNTSNFECRGCRFNSNELNFHFHEKNLNYIGPSTNWEPLHEIDGDQIARMGGGVYLGNCENVKITNSRFEFNFIQAIIDNTAKNVTIHNCIMDTATLCHVAVNNQGKRTASSYSPAIDNFTLSSCTLARGARCDIRDEPSIPGFGIFYFADIGDRGGVITFKNIIVSDDMEVDKNIDAHYEDIVFDIFNTSSVNPCVLNLEGNSFYSAEATKIFNAVQGSSGSFRINDFGNEYGDKTMISGVSSVITIVEK
ncbi:MAG: right-handed parallel beta-helix repeat-containing protein, partial [Treponema sp.]|nr:right-handed parallel beta-helix repeat-containing protein [Treponema sp.]